MDIEKAFDSLDRNFLFSTLEKYGLGKNFISWVKILLKNRESCVFSARQRRPSRRSNFSLFIYFSLFICFILEILFHLIRSKPETKGLAIFDHCYLYSAYTDDKTFFLQDTISIKQKFDAFHLLSYFSGIKPNFKKSEIAGIGALKGVQVTVCGLRRINLNNDTLKILGTDFSYNEKLKKEKKL